MNYIYEIRVRLQFRPRKTFNKSHTKGFILEHKSGDTSWTSRNTHSLLRSGDGHLSGGLVDLFSDGGGDVVSGLVGSDGSPLLGSDPDGLLVYVLDLLGGRGVELQDPRRARRARSRGIISPMVPIAVKGEARNSLLPGVGVDSLRVVVQEEARDSPLLVNLLGLGGGLGEGTSDDTGNLGIRLVGDCQDHTQTVGGGMSAGVQAWNMDMFGCQDGIRGEREDEGRNLPVDPTLLSSFCM
jgi:hypothetical protein